MNRICIKTGKNGFLKDVNGAGHIKTAIIILALAMIFSAVYVYAERIITINGIEDAMQMTLDSTLMQRSVKSYKTLDDGIKVGFSYDEDMFLRLFAVNFDSLSEEGDLYLLKSGGGETIWKMTKPVVSTENDGEPKLCADFIIYLPIGAGAISLGETEVHMHVISSLVFDG